LQPNYQAISKQRSGAFIYNSIKRKDPLTVQLFYAVLVLALVYGTALYNRNGDSRDLSLQSTATTDVISLAEMSVDSPTAGTNGYFNLDALLEPYRTSRELSASAESTPQPPEQEQQTTQETAVSHLPDEGIG
jgi:hypothetical protein